MSTSNCGNNRRACAHRPQPGQQIQSAASWLFGLADKAWLVGRALGVVPRHARWQRVWFDLVSCLLGGFPFCGPFVFAFFELPFASFEAFVFCPECLWLNCLPECSGREKNNWAECMEKCGGSEVEMNRTLGIVRYNLHRQS